MKKTLISILILYCNTLVAQNITLDSCYSLTKQNFQFENQKELNIKSSELKIENLKIIYFPALTLNAQVSYQSSGIEINLPIHGVEMPEVPLDQYKAYLEISQVIYDGGAVKTQKTLVETTLLAENKSVEIEFETLKEQVNQIYFLIILFQKQEEIIDLLFKNLETRLATVESGVKNGVLTAVNYDIILAEKLKAEQQLMEIESGKKASIKVLEELTGSEFSDKIQVEYPEIEISTSDTTIYRAEIDLLELQKQALAITSDLSKTQRLPKVAAFAQAGYGRPGLNMLSDEFNPYFIAGISASWNIWDWNKSNRERQILQVSSKIIDIQKENFETSVKIELESIISTIEKLEEQIAKDDEIIELRNKIIKAYEAQLLNGTITSSEYIIELNAVTEAKLNMEIHKIQLVQAKVDYLKIRGSN